VTRIKSFFFFPLQDGGTPITFATLGFHHQQPHNTAFVIFPTKKIERVIELKIRHENARVTPNNPLAKLFNNTFFRVKEEKGNKVEQTNKQKNRKKNHDIGCT
jgi:hypothetical protein